MQHSCVGGAAGHRAPRARARRGLVGARRARLRDAYGDDALRGDERVGDYVSSSSDLERTFSNFFLILF